MKKEKQENIFSSQKHIMKNLTGMEAFHMSIFSIRVLLRNLLKVTMTGYEKYLGTEFGKTIPGTFTDEPQIESPGGIRWTPDLFDVFMKQWNYDLRTQLPSLYEETGDWKKIRHNYTQTLLQLFIDRWAKPWYAYCEEKGLEIHRSLLGT